MKVTLQLSYFKKICTELSYPIKERKYIYIIQIQEFDIA